MKRVHLWRPGDPRISPAILRAAAVTLGEYSVGRGKRPSGDPVHDWITEGRRLQWERAHAAGHSWALKGSYSSCGDLAHWLLMCLGCRDERVVNRSDDGGEISWVVGANISRLVALPWYREEGAGPFPGDILHVASPDHVAVLLDQESADQWHTADYGQPHAERKDCLVVPRRRGLIVRGRHLEGWVDLESMLDDGAFTESAIVPDAFPYGVLDDNPYDEDLRIPV